MHYVGIMDTTNERAAVAALSSRPKAPDPVLAGLADLRDAVAALRADVAALRDVMTATLKEPTA